MKRHLTIWWLLPGVILADQATKWLASRLNLVQLNQGIAFGWGQNLNLLVLIVVVVVGLVVVGVLRHDRRYNLGLALLIAGGVSNLIDRLIWGGVRDFIPMLGWRNNLADLAIVLGVIILAQRGMQTHFLAKVNYV